MRGEIPSEDEVLTRNWPFSACHHKNRPLDEAPETKASRTVQAKRRYLRSSPQLGELGGTKVQREPPPQPCHVYVRTSRHRPATGSVPPQPMAQSCFPTPFLASIHPIQAHDQARYLSFETLNSDISCSSSSDATTPHTEGGL